MQILLSVYRLNEEASSFVKQTLPNMINTYGSIVNPTWMNFAIKIIDSRHNHSLVAHLNNKCRCLKRLVHNIAEQNIFAPKLSPDHHVYPWTEHGGGKKKAKKVYIVIPRSLSNKAPKSIEDVKALLRPAQQQFSGLESQFLDMVQDLIRNQYRYSRDRLVELVDQQFQVSNADENDLNINGQQFGLSNEAIEGNAGNDGQQFGLLSGANHGLNLTNANEDKAAKDLSDFIEDHIIEDLLFEDHDASGHMGGSISDNTKTASTAAGDPFDSHFADEAADKDQRQQDAEERANNQNSQNSKQENRLTMLMIMDCLK
jgi:hypothetical protein